MTYVRITADEIPATWREDWEMARGDQGQTMEREYAGPYTRDGHLTYRRTRDLSGPAGIRGPWTYYRWSEDAPR